MSRDRFTEKDENGKWRTEMLPHERINYLYRHDNTDAIEKDYLYGPAIERLAAYEDLIFSPEVLQAIIKEWKEWADAKNDGRLRNLPCNVGDTVWVIEDRFVNGRKLLRCRINEFTISDKEGTIYAVLDGAEEFCFMRRFKAVPAESFGRTVFLNKAEAETALKLQKMEKKNEI